MTKKRRHLPAKLGAVLLILTMVAALLSGSALAWLPDSDVHETVTLGEDAYVQLTSFYEYTVYTYELVSGSGPPGMDFLESGDTVGLSGTPTQAGTYTGTGTVYLQSNDGGQDEQAAFSFTIVVEGSADSTEQPDEPINQNTHDHTFHSEWSYDEESHWHDCDCGSRDGYEPHRVSEWATKSDGSLLGACDVCGASVVSVGNGTVAPETTEPTPENTPEAKEKPALGTGGTEPQKSSKVTVLVVVLLAVVLLLLGAVVFLILRIYRGSAAHTASARAGHSRFKS